MIAVRTVVLHELQMLEDLSEDLITRVLKAAPLDVRGQLPLLPVHMHELAIHAAHPELAAHCSIALDCASASPLVLNTAFRLWAAHPNARKLSLSSVFPVHTRYEGMNLPSHAEKTHAIANACRTCKEVSLDIETRLQKVAGLWTELLCALRKNTVLCILEVRPSFHISLPFSFCYS